MTKNIIIEKVYQDIPQMALKKDDYFAAYPMDFYSGAAIYGIKDIRGIVKLHYCIETLEGKIQANEVGTANSRMLTQSDFKKAVNHKVFARVIIDNNLPSIAVNDLRELLRGE